MADHKYYENITEELRITDISALTKTVKGKD
jgi:hypothetical protein